MTTLNTIIEEEKKNMTNKYDLRYFDGSTYAVTEEFEKDFTTAMQRASEAGAEERDTYWKERVQKALKTVAYREVTVRGGMYSDDKYRGPNEEVIRLVKMQDVELVLGITNEDNLK